MKKIKFVIIFVLLITLQGFILYFCYKQNAQVGLYIIEVNEKTDKLERKLSKYIEFAENLRISNISSEKSYIHYLGDNQKEWINNKLGFKIILPNNWFPLNEYSRKFATDDERNGFIFGYFGNDLNDSYFEIQPVGFDFFLDIENVCKIVPNSITKYTYDCFDENGEYEESFILFFSTDSWIFKFDKEDKETVDVLKTIEKI